ncbi:MAG: TM2 domain-containing protein [Bacteroidaceae bacterium]|nr:TM2 domain-containing protein [Bacteroidaceae bacterium]
MDAEKVNLFIATKGDNFPAESIPMIRERLMNLSSNNEMAIMAMDYTNPVLTIILSVLFGELGIDRFIIGDIGLGIGKLLTGGGCGIWWLIDLFLIMDATKKKNLEKLMMTIG